MKLTALERTALLAAFHAPAHTLRRTRGYFIAPQPTRTSGPVTSHGFTKRLALRLQRDRLVALDDDICPSTLTLTTAGVRVVESQLLEPANA